MDFIDAKTIISGYSEKNSWFGTNYNMNIYKGCSHGCIYCDSRSECYRIENFDTVRAKKNAIEIIERELSSKRRKGVVGTGAMSDPYNPFEKKYKLTRESLKLIDRYEFGIAIATKSSLITRDIDILKSIGRHSPVLAKITITTSDDNLSRIIEPSAPLSSERFKALEKLSSNNVFSGILLMPILPFIEDNINNIGNIIVKANEAGVKFIYPAFGMTLRQNQRTYYYNKLDQNFPGLKDRYISTYKNNYQCSSLYAKNLWNFFKKECDKRNIIYKMKDIIKIYKEDYKNPQISFFD